MPSAAEYRKLADTLYRLAKAHDSDEEALVLLVRAVELDVLADELERGQVQQSGTQPPAAQQPAHQQQPLKDDD